MVNRVNGGDGNEVDNYPSTRWSPYFTQRHVTFQDNAFRSNTTG